MNAFFPDLHKDRFYCFVLGPGLGECVLLRVPPNIWVVIDSFYSGSSRPAAIEVLRHYDAPWSALVLTHPHEDHYRGFDELLPMNATGLVGCVHPRLASGVGTKLSKDPLEHLGHGAITVYDAIIQRWEKIPSSRWETNRGDRRQIGTAEFKVLHPPFPVDPNCFSRQRCNEISTAIEVRWRHVVLLLAGDVVNPHWSDIKMSSPQLANHAAMKVPHHGSPGAINEAYTNGHQDRTWVVTPFVKSTKLPSAGDGHGMDLLLRSVTRLHLTSLPFRHDCEHEAPCVANREAIRDGTRPRAVDVGLLPNGKRGKAPARSTSVERHVVLGFDESGQVVEIVCGPGTLEVSQG